MRRASCLNGREGATSQDRSSKRRTLRSAGRSALRTDRRLSSHPASDPRSRGPSGHTSPRRHPPSEGSEQDPRRPRRLPRESSCHGCPKRRKDCDGSFRLKRFFLVRRDSRTGYHKSSPEDRIPLPSRSRIAQMPKASGSPSMANRCLSPQRRKAWKASRTQRPGRSAPASDRIAGISNALSKKRITTSRHGAGLHGYRFRRL